MKKLTSLILGCIMITGTFASCGKNNDSSSSIKTPAEELIGSWSMDIGEDSNEMIMIFNDGALSVESDFSYMIAFNGMNFIIYGDDCGSEGTVFEDNKLTVNMNGMELINMTRIEGEGDSLDGVYSELGGALLGDLGEDSDIVTKVKIEGDKFFIRYENFCDYAVEGDDTVVLLNPPEMFDTGSDDNKASLTFKIDGDTLSLTDKNGKTDTLTRVK